MATASQRAAGVAAAAAVAIMSLTPAGTAAADATPPCVVQVPVEVRHTTSQPLPAHPFARFCHVLVTPPAGSTRPSPTNVSMFYDGGGMWAWRLTADAPGTWAFASVCPSDPSLEAKGALSCAVDPGDPGPAALGGLVADETFPRLFRRERLGAGGRPVYPFLSGAEADFIAQLGFVGGIGTNQRDRAAGARGGSCPPGKIGPGDCFVPPVLDAALARLTSLGVNHVLAQVFANSSSWMSQGKLPPDTPPRISPAPASAWASQDQLELNLELFRTWDAVLAKHGAGGTVTFHLMIYVSNKGVAWPPEGSLADEVYWRHCLARFGAFPSTVWDVSKEAGGRGVGNEYMFERLLLIHELNAHGRPVTAHSGLSWTNDCRLNGAGRDPCTFSSVQVHFPGDIVAQAPMFYNDTLKRVAASDKPVVQVESLYDGSPAGSGMQSGCLGSCCNACASTAREAGTVPPTMWDMVFAGAAGVVWYRTDLAWDWLSWTGIANGTAGWMSAAHSTGRAVANMRSFFTSSPFGDPRPLFFNQTAVSPASRCGVTAVSPANATVRCSVGLARPANGGAVPTTTLFFHDARTSFMLARGAGVARGQWWDPACDVTTRACSAPWTPSPSGAHRPPAHFAASAVLHYAVDAPA